MGFFQALYEALNGVPPGTPSRVIPPLFPERTDIPPLILPDDEPQRAVPGAGDEPLPLEQGWRSYPLTRDAVLNLHLDQECE